MRTNSISNISVKQTEYVDYDYISDGSKTNDLFGAAVVSESIMSASLPAEASIFTAEAYVIQMALTIIRKNTNTNRTTLSNSRRL